MIDATIKDPMELLQTPQAVLVIDLLEHAMNLTSVQLEALIDPPKGIYLKGSVTPLIKEGETYYPKSKMFQEQFKIRALEEVYYCKEDIVDKSGNLVISAMDLDVRSKYLTQEPELPITAVKVALTLVLNYLGNLSPYTRYIKTCSLENLIKPEHYNLVEDDEYETAFEHLLNIVFEFVDKDTWFIYFHRIQGNSLIIEKMVDWRIYRYHELIWEKEQQLLDPYAD